MRDVRFHESCDLLVAQRELLRGERILEVLTLLDKWIAPCLGLRDITRQTIDSHCARSVDSAGAPTVNLALGLLQVVVRAVMRDASRGRRVPITDAIRRGSCGGCA